VSSLSISSPGDGDGDGDGEGGSGGDGEGGGGGVCAFFLLFFLFEVVAFTLLDELFFLVLLASEGAFGFEGFFLASGLGLAGAFGLRFGGGTGEGDGDGGGEGGNDSTSDMSEGAE